MKQSGMRGLVTPIIPGSARSTRATLLNASPQRGVVGVTRWQGPDTMQMLGKQYPGIDGERMLLSGFPHHAPQNGAAFS